MKEKGISMYYPEYYYQKIESDSIIVFIISMNVLFKNNKNENSNRI